MDGDARRRRRSTLALVLLTASVIHQQQIDPFLAVAAQKGCSDDFHKFCSQKNASKADQSTCLRQYWVSLSQACRRTLGSRSSSGSNGSGTNSAGDEQTK
jgi:hypothetical protein